VGPLGEVTWRAHTAHPGHVTLGMVGGHKGIQGECIEHGLATLTLSRSIF